MVTSFSSYEDRQKGVHIVNIFANSLFQVSLTLIMAYFRALLLFLRRPERTELGNWENSLGWLNKEQKRPENMGKAKLLTYCSAGEQRGPQGK